MRYVIYGAGGIGGVIGSRLHQAEIDTTLIARGEHAEKIAQRGLRLIAPKEDVLLPVPVVEHPRGIYFTADTVVLMCMKSQHTLGALEDLAGVAPLHTLVACVQNGVANEAMALRYFPNVYGVVVNLPAMFLTPGEVITHAYGHGGILDTGRFPRGVDDAARQIATDLTRAGFSSEPDSQIMRKKYAKLLLNLYNVLQAGLSDADGAGDARQIGKIIRDEALACFRAAGIDCATKAEVEARRQGIYRMEDIAGYKRTAGSSWQSLARGTGDIETEYLNGEICRLGRMHGVATPGNDACVVLARQLIRDQQGPGTLTASELLSRIAKD